LHLSFAGCAMKIIYTRKGEEIFVDDEDFDWLNSSTWRLDKDGYAVRTPVGPRLPGKPKIEFMHRLVMGLSYGDRRKVDHVHHVKTDNRKSELRICTNQQNGFNSKRRSHNKSGYKGVVLVDRDPPWRASIVVNKKQRYLGLFETPELAHEFYCLAADLVYGEFANYGEPKVAAPDQQEQIVIAPLVKAALGE
jgi:hypothetical protein